jgi:hypothetical protein
LWEVGLTDFSITPKTNGLPSLLRTTHTPTRIYQQKTHTHTNHKKTHTKTTQGHGFRYAMKGLDGGRINIATCSVGAVRALVVAFVFLSFLCALTYVRGCG